MQHLRNLYANPVFAWREIDKAFFGNKLAIIRENLFVFLIINPLLFTLIHLVLFEGLKKLFLKGIFYPFIYTGFGILLVFIVSLILEEIYKLTSHRDPQQNIFKWLTFSSLPLFSVSGFLDIPFFGGVFFLTGLIYSGYLAKTGIEKFLWIIKSPRRKIFLVSSIVATSLFLILLRLFIELFVQINSWILRIIQSFQT